MDIFKYIDPLIFVIAFSVGIFFTYITTPSPEIIVKYPTPENAGKITYIDDANVCYKYKVEEVKCTGKEKKIPIQQHDPDRLNKHGILS